MAIGSNLRDRFANLKSARARLTELQEIQAPIRSSFIYETDPVGCERGAPTFFNAVVEFDYDASPLSLLRQLREIEEALGRPGKHPRNVSRLIDLDILYFADQIVNTGELQLPHPRMTERRFVLEPLADIRPDLILPKQTETVAVLLARLPASPSVNRTAEQW